NTQAKKNPQPSLGAFGIKTLAMTYSRMLDAHYHRRVSVSLPSTEWDRVVPLSYCHQGEGGGSPAIPEKQGMTALALSEVGEWRTCCRTSRLIAKSKAT